MTVRPLLRLPTGPARSAAGKAPSAMEQLRREEIPLNRVSAKEKECRRGGPAQAGLY